MNTKFRQNPWRLFVVFGVAFAVAVCGLQLTSSSANAQRKKEYADPLEKEMADLLETLRKEGDSSVPKDRRGIQRMSPEEFEQFQQKFLERFFEDDKSLAESSGDDDLADDSLKRTARQVRNRKIGIYERQTQSQLNAYQPVVSTARLSIVSVQIDGKQVALGTVADTRGAILTKASELGDAEKVSCLFANGQSFDANVLARNKKHDLALIHVPAVTTIPIQWVESPAELGTTVVTSNHTGMPMNVGTVSVLPRSLVGANLAFLGVGPGPHESGVVILSVERSTAADRAGLKKGDVIVTLSDVKTNSVTSLVNAIRSHSPGTNVVIEYLRGGERLTTEAVLDSASMPGDRELRIQLMNRMGAIPSKRKTEFPSVLQHDSPLFPEQCGGPLVNLDGKAIGINIARGGRVESYAIPATTAKNILAELKAEQN